MRYSIVIGPLSVAEEFFPKKQYGSQPKFLNKQERLVLFLTEEAYSHGDLKTRELGQTPLC